MKTKILTALAAASFTLLLNSCADTWQPDSGKDGDLSLASIKIEISEFEKTVEVDARADASPDINSFIVTINRADDNTLVQSFTYGEMPEIVPLSTGKYKIQVASHATQPNGVWDDPYYVGESEEFEIQPNKLTTVGTVSCAFRSLKVGVVFDDELLAILGDDAQVTVVGNDNASLTYTPATTESGFFAMHEGANTIVAYFTGTVDGYPENSHEIYEATQGDYLIIRYRVAMNPEDPQAPEDPTDPGTPEVPDTEGNISTQGGIRISAELIRVDSDFTIDNSEEIIGAEPQQPEDPSDPGKPDTPDIPDTDPIEISSKGLELAPAVNEATDSWNTDAIVSIDAAAGISHLYLYITTTNKGFKDTLAEMFGKDPEKGFDLVLFDENKVILDLFGYTSSIAGAESVNFNIKDFIGALAAFDGTHTFRFDVVDADGAQKSASVIFTAK